MTQSSMSDDKLSRGKHLPEVRRVTQAAYRVEDRMESLAAVVRRGAWGSPDPMAARPVRRDPYRLPMAEVTRKQAELILALQSAAVVLEKALEHMDDTAEEADLAIAGGR